METTQGLQGLKIALLIDFDNVILGVEDPGFDVELVVNCLRSRGHVVMGRAYGDWYRHNRHRRKLMEQGIELVETPVFGPVIKNSADIRIVLDAFEIAMLQSHIDTFCLVSGDSDFLPLIKKLQYLGKQVIVIAGNKFTSELVRRNCNEFVWYENLLAESVGATEDVSVIEGAFALLQRTIHTLHERGMDVRSSTVKQMMLQLNPAFSERNFGCSQFKQFLDKAFRVGMVKLGGRDPISGEFAVLLPNDDENGVPNVAPAVATSAASAPPRGADDREGSGRYRRGGRFRRGRLDEEPIEAQPTTAGEPETVTPVPSLDAGERIAEFDGAATPAREALTGPAPANSFLNRSGLRRGRLRFSARGGGVSMHPEAGEDENAPAPTWPEDEAAARAASAGGAGGPAEKPSEPYLEAWPKGTHEPEVWHALEGTIQAETVPIDDDSFEDPFAEPEPTGAAAASARRRGTRGARRKPVPKVAAEAAPAAKAKGPTAKATAEPVLPFVPAETAVELSSEATEKPKPPRRRKPAARKKPAVSE